MQEAECFPLTKDTWGISVVPHHTGVDGHVSYFSGKFETTVTDLGYLTIDRLNQVENLVFSFFLFEPNWCFDVTNWINGSLEYCNKSNIFPNLKNVYLLYDSCNIHLEKIDTKYNVKKFYLSYFLLRSTLTSTRSKNFKLNNWTPNNKKALMLIGDGGRKNRFPVLYEFYKNNSLHLLDYSLRFNYINRGYEKFFLNPVFQVVSKEFEVELGQVFADYFKLQNDIPDDDFFYSLQNTGNHFYLSAYSYPKQWNNASLVIVMETYFEESFKKNSECIFFTEKIFKPLLSKKPFVTCSDCDYVYNRLKSLGFKTFLEYTDHPNIIEKSLSLRTYTKVTYNRIASFLENMEKYKEEIERDVEHNYNLWLKMGQEAWDNLYSTIPSLKQIDKSVFSDMFIFSEYRTYLRNNIKQIFE